MPGPDEVRKMLRKVEMTRTILNFYGVYDSKCARGENSDNGYGNCALGNDKAS